MRLMIEFATPSDLQPASAASPAAQPRLQRAVAAGRAQPARPLPRMCRRAVGPRVGAAGAGRRRQHRPLPGELLRRPVPVSALPGAPAGGDWEAVQRPFATGFHCFDCPEGGERCSASAGEAGCPAPTVAPQPRRCPGGLTMHRPLPTPTPTPTPHPSPAALQAHPAVRRLFRRQVPLCGQAVHRQLWGGGGARPARVHAEVRRATAIDALLFVDL